MAILKKPPKRTPTRAALESRMAQLDRRDRALLEEQLQLEGAGVKPSPATDRAAQIHSDAEALLEGVAPAPASPNRSNRLHEVITERATIAAALELARLRLTKLLVDQSREIATDIEAKWNENIRAVAALIEQLRVLARERDRLRAEWRARTGLPVTPACGVHADAIVSHPLFVDGPPYRFLQAARRAGII